MLIGIDPILGPDCLALLRAMGHGDEVVLADANFPAARPRAAGWCDSTEWTSSGPWTPS